ncbi:AIPR family protein [Neotamlana laminarinivorans]|uniref:AIPR family protein n=1 Tax=Neotamlana laminarinivorans TaxID=2883124 RepID=A0A9X1I1E7_9FLAO|nr:AIPR family protein [Tamlana laminarinivorans]MCB4800029.1 AIPR family protein [Tamlana laminarinivorans]
MILEEYFNYRNELLDQSKDDEGFIQENLILSQVLPSMLDAKLIDSEDFTNSYFKSTADKLKINAYSINESGERLQLFLIDENSIDLSATSKELMISTKASYESQFKRCTNFHNKAIKGHLNDEIQDSSPVRPLISSISSSQGAEQFDVVEIFLITLTSTVSLRGASPQPNRIEFEDEEIVVTYQKNRERKKKDLLLKKRIIDLNFLYNVLISQGSREALTVNFEKTFGESLYSIKAADEDYFESYLCVLPASILSRLYKEFSTRLLEKNVRSFLQFRGVNKGIRETIRKEPEKFVAYNNGLTITATDADISYESGQYKIKSLTDFQIVNGGQTTATIYFTQKDGFDISKVKVMAKINVAKEATDEELEELISNISTYSNAQSRVSKVDLRSRNPQLVRIKSLSESVMTPSGKKWFFEKAKGEFNTKLRIAGSNKRRLAKEYPTQRRFSKELMAKYYSAWGNQPHLVKKGGEKIFRYFIEKLTGEGEFKKPINVNRDFYEELIAKIILFRSLEKIYGAGKNSMGQLRSAAVPYSLSVLFMITDADKNAPSFDLLKIWLNEELENDLAAYLTQLLKLVNELIKKYSESDDYGEYSKKEELWKRISLSKEIKEFTGKDDTKKIIDKYGISKTELKKRKGSNENLEEVDFKSLIDNVLIHSNGINYYKSIQSNTELLSGSDERKLSGLVHAIINKKDIEDDLVLFESSLTNKLRVEVPDFFDNIEREDSLLYNTLDYVITHYNKCINEKNDVLLEFQKIEAIAKAKQVKYASVFDQIGKKLVKGIPPKIKEMYYASYILKDKNIKELKPIKTLDISKVIINELLLRKMFEWDSTAKILSPKERAYIADFAWGLKKLNSFHEKNIRRHLKNLVNKGYLIY